METKIEDVLKKTETIVNSSGIKEDLRNAAFSEVFRLLMSSDTGAKKVPAKVKSGQVTIPKPKSKTRGNAAKLIDELINEGFFSEKRRDIDCIEQIDLSKGVKIPRNQMATILVRKLRSGVFKREKTNNGYVYFVEQ